MLADGTTHSVWDDYDKLKAFWIFHRGRLLHQKMKTVIIECEDTKSSREPTTGFGESAP